MVGVSASVNLPLHYKVQKFSSGTGSPGWGAVNGCMYISKQVLFGIQSIKTYTTVHIPTSFFRNKWMK